MKLITGTIVTGVVVIILGIGFFAELHPGKFTAYTNLKNSLWPQGCIEIVWIPTSPGPYKGKVTTTRYVYPDWEYAEGVWPSTVLENADKMVLSIRRFKCSY